MNIIFIDWSNQFSTKDLALIYSFLFFSLLCSSQRRLSSSVIWSVVPPVIIKMAKSTIHWMRHTCKSFFSILVCFVVVWNWRNYNSSLHISEKVGKNMWSKTFKCYNLSKEWKELGELIFEQNLELNSWKCFDDICF